MTTKSRQIVWNFIPKFKKIPYTFTLNEWMQLDQRIANAVDDWDNNHYLKKSESVINGLVAVHKDTDEPCAMNPCTEALELQELGINMEEERSC